MPLDLANANLYDLAVKLLLRRYPEALLRLVSIQASPGTLTSIETNIIIKELAADDVFVYVVEGDREGLLVEYQIEVDRALIRRWLQKALAFEEELGFPVILLVVYLRKSDRATFPSDFTVGKGPLTNYYRFACIRLWEAADRIRSGELPELTPLLPLVEDRPPEQAVRESREIIRKLPVSADVRNELLGVCYLIGLKYLMSSVVDAIFREDLPMVKEAGIIGEWIEESLQKGLAQGREEGREEEARSVATGFLERRFGSIPEGLRLRIAAAPKDWCETLIFNASEVESLSELRLP